MSKSQVTERQRLQRSLSFARVMTALNAALTVYLLYRLAVTEGARHAGGVGLTLAVAAVTVVGIVRIRRLQRQQAD